MLNNKRSADGRPGQGGRRCEVLDDSGASPAGDSRGRVTAADELRVLFLGFGMGVPVVRTARGGFVAILGLGLLASCSTMGLGPMNRTAGASAASDRVEVVDNFGAGELEHQFEVVAQRVSPAVVAISATDATVDADGALRSDDINPEKLSGLLDSVDRTVGTGFVVDPDGFIVTNDHVVAHSEQLWVTTDSHKVYPAIIVGSDPRADIAVLKIPASNLPVVHFSSTGRARRGQWTIAVGNPYGLAASGDMAVSVGIVSATGRSLPHLAGKEDRLYTDLIQTTAQINPGNSGGPLFDLNGDVIGINTAVILPQKQTNGIGFAIPADIRVSRIIENLKQGKEVVYAYLGVRVTGPTPRERRDAGLQDELGARIESVEPGSPAAHAKLQVGDIMTQLQGDVIHDSDEFVRVVGAGPVSEPVKAVIYRHGAQTVELSLRARETIATTVTRDSQRLRWHGMLLGPIPAHWSFPVAKRPEHGVMVVGIDVKSPFTKDGVVAGSVITTIAGKAIHSLPELQRVINDTPDAQCRIELAHPTNAVVSAN